MKIEAVIRYIDTVNTQGELDWVKEMLISNLSKSCDKIVSLEDVYVGQRYADRGWVLGYRTESGGILDIGMLADWYCDSFREVELEDIKHLCELDFGKTFDPIRRPVTNSI